MQDKNPATVTVIGLGAMGRPIAAELVKAGHPTTVWNRSPGRAGDLVALGAAEADSPAAAVAASEVVLVAVLDYASVHEVLDPVAGQLAGKALVNLTTGTPEQARRTAAWAAEHGIGYLDGAMMAVPAMIGRPEAKLLYSGSTEVFDRYRPVLDLLAESTFYGPDAGLASLYDLALLSGMYAMFFGFQHGAAMVATAGVSATEFAGMATSWLSAVMGAIHDEAAVIDGGNYRIDAQDANFTKSALDVIVRASRDAGIGVDVVAPMQELLARQIAAGHAEEAATRTYEEIRHPR
ncbi:NAD(P)-dependent oxidoreductase [Amycolatopsis suaedae]|uniref:NAD(P)-dependent oxidoreductase n=1 Tax=Amycolatopsis suaedae TaxID=2510978 RepID=UPI001F1086FE|nr:NAD(P)-binding domain-containing protein [Amycolatopsis suaedae]